ncbi:MAG: hypothetical protein ABFD18_03560 [Syntrophomonas sp.]
MPDIKEIQQDDSELLKSLVDELNEYRKIEPQKMSWQEEQRYIDLLNIIVKLYEERKRNYYGQNPELDNKTLIMLKELASSSLDQLGSITPCLVSLKHYNAEKYGPFLGISNDGEDVEVIRNAALMSPKARVLGAVEPIVLGMAIDAERLGAVGEVAVGPPEYKKIHLGRTGCLLATTNVGTRVNVRYLKQRLLVKVPIGPRNRVLYTVIKRIAASVKPFLKTPDMQPRPCTVYLQFEGVMNKERWINLINDITRHMEKDRFCDSAYHKIGLKVEVDSAKRGFEKALRAIDIVRMVGIKEVSLDGEIRKESGDKISMPGLLHHFNEGYSTALLQYAKEHDISLTPWNLVDIDTVARHIASGLGYARSMGLELGKYGLFPLTLSESREVIKLIQNWLAEWTAAPALYLDLPIVDDDRVYNEKDMMKGILKWIKNASEAGVKVVLLDTADKDKKRRIMKDDDEDGSGILTRHQISGIDAYAKQIDIRLLWAGGISLQQAFVFGELGVFGIYVTSAASEPRPVRKGYMRDIMLSHSNVPTLNGVLRTKLLLEAGFLVQKLKGASKEEDSNELRLLTDDYLTAFTNKSDEMVLIQKENQLETFVEKNWAWILGR